MYFCLSDIPHLGAELSVDVGAEAPGLFGLCLSRWHPDPVIQTNGDWGPIIIKCHIKGRASVQSEGARERREPLIFSCIPT